MLGPLDFSGVADRLGFLVLQAGWVPQTLRSLGHCPVCPCRLRREVHPELPCSSDALLSDRLQTLKRYPCRQCEQSFHTPSSLRKHIRNNHDTVKKVYTCG